MSTQTLPTQSSTVESGAADAEFVVHGRLKRHPVPIGRHREREELRELLGGGGPHGPALLLRGAAGIGKSLLLEEAATMARGSGFRVLRAVGVESEAELPFSGLHQLLRPLRGSTHRLPPDQQNIIKRMFGNAEQVLPDGPAAAAAVSALSTAVGSPLLLLVDDVQWLDHSSTEVLVHLAHRREPGATVVLAAARTGYACAFEQAGIPVRGLEPLDPSSADRLLDERHPGLAVQVRRALLEEAEGNPLALLELPALLNGRQLSGRDPLPVPLPLSRRLRLLYADRVRKLTPAVSWTLVLAALEDSGDVRTVRTAAGAAWDVAALAAVELADLVRVGEGRITFRHPLIRSVVVHVTPLHVRMRAHRALARCLEGDAARAARHLAAAALEADETVAAALEEAAGRAARRGGAAGAVTTLVRAAELSPAPTGRAHRLATAAHVASHAGRLDHAERLLADVRRVECGTSGPAGAARTTAAYLQLHREGNVDAAHALLLSALPDGRADGTGRAPAGGLDEILYTLLSTCFYGGWEGQWEAFDAVMRRHAGGASAETLLYYEAIAHAPRRSAAVRLRIREQLDGPPEESALWLVPRLGLAALQIDALDLCRSRLKATLELERDGGAFASSVCSLLLLAVEARLSGSWAESEAYARQALALAEQVGYQLYAAVARCQLLFLAAYRGESDAVHDLARTVAGWVGPRRLGMLVTELLHARGLLALSQGDYEHAYGLVSRAVPPGEPGFGSHHAAVTVMDLVEAAMRTGRTDEARECLAAARRAGTGSISPRLRLLTRAAEALAAGNDERAGRVFAEALTDVGTDRWPFDRARVQLCYGGWLRRARNLSAARDQLRSALDTFERLGAGPWAARAEGELRATGAGQGGGPDDERLLTPQERQIAVLAARGMTNKQIGERLQLSHRTVSAHLYRVFPKLGISSRAALGRALDQLPTAVSDNR